jgi:hypothetical protein
MYAYNVHTVKTKDLEALANNHARSGWKIHHVRWHDKDNEVVVVFERSFQFEHEFTAYIEARDKKRAERTQVIDALKPAEVKA